MSAAFHLHRSNLPALPAGTVRQAPDSAPISLWRQLYFQRHAAQFRIAQLRAPARSETDDNSSSWFRLLFIRLRQIPSGRSRPPGASGFSGSEQSEPRFSSPRLPHHRHGMTVDEACAGLVLAAVLGLCGLYLIFRVLHG